MSQYEGKNKESSAAISRKNDSTDGKKNISPQALTTQQSLFSHWKEGKETIHASTNMDIFPGKTVQQKNTGNFSTQQPGGGASSVGAKHSIPVPTVVKSAKQRKIKQRKEQEEDLQKNKPMGMSTTSYLKLSSPQESSKMVAQAKFSQFKKDQLKQLKKNKQARRQFNSRVSQFERTLVQRKIVYGSSEYDSLTTQYFNNFPGSTGSDQGNGVVQQSKAGTGQPAAPSQSPANKTGMPDNLKSGVESLSGVDISDVRVHYNSDKPAQVQAHAFTQGSDIHVAPGQERHVPHEAWHTVQQKQGRVSPNTSVNNTPVNDDVSLENEADVMGAKAVVQSKAISHPVATQPERTVTKQVKSIQRVGKEENTGIGQQLAGVIGEIELLQVEATAMSGGGEEDNSTEEVKEKLAKLKTIASGDNEKAKVEALKLLKDELPKGVIEGVDKLPDNLGDGDTDKGTKGGKETKEQVPQQQVAQRIATLAVVGIGAAVVSGIIGIGIIVKKLKEKAIFEEFGNKHRRKDLDPDKVGEDINGIHVISTKDQGARPEDAPPVNEVRIKMHKLHSTHLYIKEKHPEFYKNLPEKHGLNLKAKLLELSGNIKVESKAYKKEVKDMATNTSIDDLRKAYKQKLDIIGNQAEQLTKELLGWMKTETKDSANIDTVHKKGTDIWRDKWHKIIMAVNTVLHGKWPVWKGKLKKWTKERKDKEGLDYMDENQINSLDYIGSLAKGYKGPPKQAVRFMPEKFDVDANLDAPPLAAYAILKKGAIADRNRILSSKAGIEPLTEMEVDVQKALKAKGLIQMGMDPEEPFEVMIDADGVNKVNGTGAGLAKKSNYLSVRDQELRDRIFWTRHNNVVNFNNIGADLQSANLATMSGGKLVLKDHDPDNNIYAYTEKELNKIERILKKYGA